MHNTSKNHVSISQLADSLVAKIKPKLSRFKTEEDLRIAFEKILEPALKEAGIKSEPKYERSIYHGRADALHGQVVIEYEPPCAFRKDKNIKHAFKQLVEYIQGLSKEIKETLFLFGTKFVGVGFDGEKIFFVNYVGDKKPKTKLDENDFAIRGPYDFTPESARTLITYLRALARMPLTAENLANRFGPKSEIAQKSVSAFVDAVANWCNPRVGVFFKEWKRLFGIVYGEKFGGGADKKTAALAEIYGLPAESDFQEMLFCVHTYFALLMKLISAELLLLEESSFISSFSSQLIHSDKENLELQLIDIESGGVYSRRGITNFLEGDFFRWYLETLSSPRLEEAIREMARVLSEFEPATTIIDPNSTRDLLKRLYQYLVPDVIRHNLGEYYTPDWLAELVLNEAGYKGDTRKRLLDPACGSGTFLVLAIQRAKEYARKNKEPGIETVKRIVANIWGFDLNPLAVIAARTNYLFALGDLMYQLPSLEIPVYLADSVLWPERTGDRLLTLGDAVEVHTSIGPFLVPKIWVEGKGFQMRRAAPILEQLVKDRYTTSEAMVRFKKEGLVFPPHEKTVMRFYEEILELEKEGKNGIWARFLKNAFAPMVAEKFDFVVGNPPWIRWVYLSEEYRKATLPLWKQYGLFSLKGIDAWLGGSEKDFSMLFTYAAADHYLCRNGKLGFLITQEVFKSKGAGEGFRKFRLGDRETLKVIKAHDLVTVQPFEKAANKTAAIFLKKGGQTKYPIPYIVWRRKKGVGKVSTDLTLKEALPLLKKEKLIANPMNKDNGSWQTLHEGMTGLLKIHGESFYKARLGARVEPYGIFWLEVKDVLSDGNILICNRSNRGKVKVEQVEASIESDLVFPAVSGADIGRWGMVSNIYVLITENIKEWQPFSETDLKTSYPLTYSYLVRFKKPLLARASHLISSLLKRYAFFVMSGMLPHVFERYKVVWKRMASDIFASVISQSKTPFGFKTIIPTDTTSLFATKNEDEAHYLCAIINSKPVRDFIKSFSSAGRGFGTPSVMNNVGIPKFDPKNKIHQQLAGISKKCHQLRSKDDNIELLKLKTENEMEKLEKENDKLAKQLFGI